MDTHCFFCFALLPLISTFFIFTTSSQSFLNFTTDEYALISFKNSTITSNPNSILFQNWSTHTPICSWIGVSCGKNHHRITALDLSGLGLRGTVPSHLGNLTFLRVLDISSNYFTGALPSELSKLRRLHEINMAENSLTGEIPPWLGALPELRFVSLTNNSFSGGIPTSLYNISRLESLLLEGNRLRGSIPDAIFNVSSLIEIDLRRNRLTGNLPNNMCSNTPKLDRFSVGGNQLHGEIPQNIGKCRELENLELQDNYLSGEIPSEIGSLSKLKGLYLWSNRFKGELPEEVRKLETLRLLFVANNALSGAIPRGVFNISTLLVLDLSYNNFSGALPSDMGISLINIEKIALQQNRLSGPIPTSINNASRLTYLNLQRNSLTGFVPSFPGLRLLNTLLLSVNHLTAAGELEFLSSLTNSQNLQLIVLSHNPLTGVIPNSIGNLSQSLTTFVAGVTGIRGAIPSEIGNLTNLIDLNFFGSKLSGSIPATIGNLKKLGRLDLSYNHLQESIPIHLCSMSSLGELYLSGNELHGPIPECLGEMQLLRQIYLDSNKLSSSLSSNFWNFTDLVVLDLSSNYLSGEISSQIGKLKLISEMYLSSNLLSGDIPTSIDGCESLVYLNLSDNKFGGSIPQSLGNMRGLSGLDLSNNNLSGMIPESLQDLKLLDYFNVSCNRLEGEIPNAGAFAGFTAQSFANNSGLCGAARFEVSPCLDVDARSRSKNNARLIKYILPPLVSTLVLVIVAVILIRLRKLMKGDISLDTASLGVSWRITSYIELSRATDSFREENLLGRGSFGSVFKGTFADGLHFAAKVFNLELEGANKSFETESRILSTIRHRNLVRIVGCCTNMEFKALILEFMPNGSLDKWLYSDGNDSIDILRLLNIAIDVALALEYLHHGNTFPVIHCDIKPSNVLLDGDMTARVADFGLSKLFEEGEAMIQTKTLATIGYAAPEYGSEGKVSTSADVYSFGILFLEMFTRRKPTDDMFDGEVSLKEWVSEALQANAMNKILAPALLSVEDRHFDAKEECLASAFDLAMKCLAVSPEERVNMVEAVSTLKKIKAKFGFEDTPRRQHHAIIVT